MSCSIHWTYNVLFYDVGIIQGIGLTLDDFEEKMKKIQNRGSGAPTPKKVNPTQNYSNLFPFCLFLALGIFLDYIYICILCLIKRKKNKGEARIIL